MAATSIKRYVRPLDKVVENLLGRARGRRNPFDFCEPEAAEQVLRSLTSLDRDAWAESFMQAGRRYQEEAEAQEAAGAPPGQIQRSYQRAYGFYRVARYPAPNSPKKREAYPLSQQMYLAAARYDEVPVERVEMPFRGRPGEGDREIGLLRVPAGDGRRPVVVAWGGIDSFKEERRVGSYLREGMATLSVDMPGVADAPIPGAEDAERLFDAIFDWIATDPRLDPDRVAIVGGSTGGYWAAKLAHTHRDRIRAAVDQGGCAHYAYQPEWIEKSQDGEYPLELAETLACAFGMSTFEEWLENAPRFSLLDQGVLDQPCTNLLLINGIHDSTFPIADMYLLLEHGDPKDARFYDSGHMGHTPQTEGHIMGWLKRVLHSES